ncbi:MAG: cytochrome P450 [Acidimicrobiales bacterium]
MITDLPEFVDEMVGGEVRDPYPEFADKRRHDSVWFGTFLSPSMLPGGLEPRSDWMVFRYEDCSYVLRAARIFSSAGYTETIGLVFGRTMLEMDDPEHRPHRNLVAQAFREQSLARWKPGVIGPVCHELIDRFADRGHAELVTELTSHFPVRVIARILGLPDEDFGQFHRWANHLFGVATNPEQGLRASAHLRDYFKEIVADRRRTPRDDLISDLVAAEIDGERLEDEAIYSFLRILLTGGADTTYRASGSTLFLLLTHPMQLDAVRADRRLVGAAIEESLRLEPPAVGIYRTATRDVEVGGVVIPQGASIYVVLASANHDETRWPNPDRFDIFRPPQQHLTFAQGPHMCLGMHLARMETAVLLDVVLDRLPGLRLAPDGQDPHVHGIIFRSPTSVPVTFEPQRP